MNGMNEREIKRAGEILFRRSNDEDRRASEFDLYKFKRTTGREPTTNDIIFCNSGEVGKR